MKARRSASTFLLGIVFVLCFAPGVANTRPQPAREIKDPSVLARAMFQSLHRYWAHVWAADRSTGFRSPRRYYFYNVPGGRGFITVPKECDSYGNADGSMLYGYSKAYEPNSYYCSVNESIYLDYSFLASLMRRDDGRAIVIIAHEFGHHVQKLQAWPWRERVQNRKFAQFELQADCYAGAWFAWAGINGGEIVLERNDLAHAERSLGLYGAPDGSPWYEPGSHSTHSNRQEWFLAGHDVVEGGADPFGCRETFNE